MRITSLLARVIHEEIAITYASFLLLRILANIMAQLFTAVALNLTQILIFLVVFALFLDRDYVQSESQNF